MKISKKDLINIINEEMGRIGATGVTKSALASSERERSKSIRSGETLGGDVSNRERAIIQDVEELLIKIAESDDLNKYRQHLQALLFRIRDRSQSQSPN